MHQLFLFYDIRVRFSNLSLTDNDLLIKDEQNKSQDND